MEAIQKTEYRLDRYENENDISVTSEAKILSLTIPGGSTTKQDISEISSISTKNEYFVSTNDANETILTIETT